MDRSRDSRHRRRGGDRRSGPLPHRRPRAGWRRGGRRQPAAAEACLSGDEIVTQVKKRIARLSAVPDEPAVAKFVTLLTALTSRAEREYGARGLDFTRSLREHARTVCPSDFGFHNALRTPSGRLIFLDFDYFGWDDPARLAADFLLHPGMRLSEACRRRYDTETAFRERLTLLFPLFALRWCAILLNRSSPERRAYRLHARRNRTGRRQSSVSLIGQKNGCKLCGASGGGFLIMADDVALAARHEQTPPPDERSIYLGRLVVRALDGGARGHISISARRCR